MRDCLCCEPYLKQAFASSRNLAATQGLDPGKAILGPPNASLVPATRREAQRERRPRTRGQNAGRYPCCKLAKTDPR